MDVIDYACPKSDIGLTILGDKRGPWGFGENKRDLQHIYVHDDVIEWKHFPHYWPFVWGIHWSPVNSLHKGQWRRALMFSLICTRMNGWVNSREAGDLRSHRAHHDVIVMIIKDESVVFSNAYMEHQTKIKYYWKESSTYVKSSLFSASPFLFLIILYLHIPNNFKSFGICKYRIIRKRNDGAEKNRHIYDEW